MPNPVRWHAGLPIEIFLERKNTKGPHETAFHQANPPGAPGPELRTDEIDVTNTLAAENARETQMKCGKIGQDRKRRAAPLDFRKQAFPGSPKCRELADDLHDAKHTDLGDIDHRIDSGFTHPRTAHAEKVDVQSPAERQGQSSGIHIAGSFAGGDQHRDRSHSGELAVFVSNFVANYGHV